MESDQRERPRIILRESCSFDTVGRDLVRGERVDLRLDTKVKHRFDDISAEVVNNDHDRQELISHLIRQVLQSRKK